MEVLALAATDLSSVPKDLPPLDISSTKPQRVVPCDYFYAFKLHLVVGFSFPLIARTVHILFRTSALPIFGIFKNAA
jgi:hypothetical protein